MEVNGEESGGKEGSNLLGSPTFTKLDNGKFKCVETGHELFEKEKDSYSHCKRCRLGLIEFALANRKAPLNMFKQDPDSRSKLKCKLTGDTVNKSEEHIWKHINGRRFFNKLEEKEAEKELLSNGLEEDGTKKSKKEQKSSVDGEEKGKKKKGKKEKKKRKERKKKEKEKKKKEKEVETVCEMKDSADKQSDAEEDDFWMPPEGERWDFDDGGDRWGSDSGSELEEEADEENGAVDAAEDDEKESSADEDGEESEELPKGTKRTSIDIEPSSVASKKKKSKKNPSQ